MCACMCALKASRSRVEESRGEAQKAVDTRRLVPMREAFWVSYFGAISWEPIYNKERGALGPGSGQSYTSGEVEGMGLRR